MSRDLPQDDHLCLQQRSSGVVVHEGGAVVREDDAGLIAVVRCDGVAEGFRGEAEPACH